MAGFACLALLASAACARSSGSTAAGAPTGRTQTASPKPDGLARVLLCEEIALRVDPTDPTSTSLDLERFGAEGGAARAATVDDLTRIVGEVLGESQRMRLDYRYQRDELICAVEVHTSALTILSAAPADERPPSFWRSDLVVFDHGQVVHHGVDEVPGPDENHSDADEIAATGAALLKLARTAH